MIDPINIGGEEYVALCEVEALDNSRLEEIDQLKARVMEFRDLLLKVELLLPYNAKATSAEITKLLNRTPAQSLEERDREVAARAISEFIKDPNKWPEWKRNYKLTSNSAGGAKG